MKNLKTFNECMRACNEGYEGTKTFGSLKKGDIFYNYSVDNGSATKQKLVFEEYKSHNGRFAIRFGTFGSSGLIFGNQAPDVLNGEDCSIFATKYANKLGIDLFSIEELSVEEAWRIAQKMKKNELRNKDVAIYEAANFTTTGYEDGKKTFAELKLGDDLFVWHQGEMKTPIKVKVIDAEPMSTKKIRIKTNCNITTNRFENVKNVIYVNDYDKYSTVMEDLGAWTLIFLGTNEEDFLNALKEYDHNEFNLSSIKDRTEGYITADVEVDILSPYTDIELDEVVRTINNAKGNNFTIAGKAIKLTPNDILKFRIKVEGNEKDLDTILDELFADLKIVHSYEYTVINS